MTFEYKMTEPDNISESLDDIEGILYFLEENHKVELAKDEPNQDYISDLETQIAAKRTEYESLGGTFD